MGDQYANHARYGSAAVKIMLDVVKLYLLSFPDETAQ